MKKLYYSISEISELLQEEQYTLRYWEKEFDMLRPKKNSAGNRIYSLKDIDLLNRIKKLIRKDELSTIDAYQILSADKIKPAKSADKKIEEAKAPQKKVEIITKEKPEKKETKKVKPEIEKTPTKDENTEEIIILPEPAKQIIDEPKIIEEDLDLSEVEVKEGEMYSLFGGGYDPKISIKRSELQKLYNALSDCIEELKSVG